MKLTPSTTKTLSNGVKIPILALGVYEAPKEETEHTVFTALKNGYRHVDCAQLYGNEREVGLGIAKFLKETPNVSRGEVFYTTKVSGDNHGYEKAKKSIIKSLEDVKEIEYIDLLLIHNPIAATEERLGTWKALQEAYAEGKVRAIGVSNYSIKHLEELYNWEGLKVEPMVNQFELNPWLTRKELCEYCEKKGMILEAFSPLTRGQKFSDPQLQELIKTSYPNQTPAQILIRWSLQMGFIPLPKSSNSKRQISNLQALDFEISDKDMKALTHDDTYFLATEDFDPIKTQP